MYIDHGGAGDWYSQGQIDDNEIVISSSKFSEIAFTAEETADLNLSFNNSLSSIY